MVLQQLVRTAAELVNDAIIITQQGMKSAFNPKIIYVNTNFCDLMGYIQEEVVGQSFCDFYKNIVDSGDLKKIQGALHQHQELSLTLSIQTKNGQERIVDAFIYPVTSNLIKQRQCYSIAVQKDISEQIKAINLLQQGYALTQAMLNASPQMTVVLDKKFSVLAANEAVSANFGVNKQFLIGKNITAFFDPDTVQRRQQKIQEVTSSKLPVRFEDRRAGEDFDITIFPVFDQHHNVSRFVVFAEKITEEKRLRQDLFDNVKRYQTIIQSAPILLFNLDVEGKFTLIEGSLMQALQKTTEDYLGKTLGEVWGHSAQVENALGCAMHGEQVFVTLHIQHLSLQTSFTPIFNDDGQVQSIIGVATDMTEQIQMANALRESEQRYALAVRGTNDGLCDWNLVTDTLYVSDRWCDMLGYSAKEIGPTLEDWWHLIKPTQKSHFRKQFRAHLTDDKTHFSCECQMLKKDGTYGWFQIRGFTLRNQSGQALRFAGALCDISERKKAEELLIHDTLHDGLTKLPNRRFLVNRLDELLKYYNEGLCGQFAIFIIDVDRFKVINDTLGHHLGDQFLVACSKRLTHALPNESKYFVARLGGDEFVVLAEDINNMEHVSDISDIIKKTFIDPFALHHRETYVTASIGAALSSTLHEQASDILRDADLAMYDAKNLGRNSFRLFSYELHNKAMLALQLETDLRQAILNEEIILYYQPIVFLHGQKLWGIECLARWQHPTRGLLSPNEFIPLAEESGLISELTRYIIKQALLQSKMWRHHPILGKSFLSINISTHQFGDIQFLQFVEEAVKNSQINQDHLVFEITESALMQDPEAATNIIKRLQELGLKICIDDFGTGYSSLSYLRLFPVDYFKLDRGFITKIVCSKQERSMVEVMYHLAQTLELEMIVEGIETEKQTQILEKLGCQLGQGYYYCRPCTVEKIEQLYQSV